MCPAIQAPSAAPSRVSETVSPVPEAPMSYLSRIAPTAPLMTAVSYPNRKPPSAAAPAKSTACPTSARVAPDPPPEAVPLNAIPAPLKGPTVDTPMRRSIREHSARYAHRGRFGGDSRAVTPAESIPAANQLDTVMSY